MKNYPWDEWKKKTKQEKEAEKSLALAKKIILKNIPNKEIVSIYVGGSFLRREMNEKSDVDLWVIVKDTKLLERIRKLGEEHRHDREPFLGISGYSIEELKIGEQLDGKLRPNPSRFLKRLDTMVLIYGKALNPKNFKMRADKGELNKLIKAFNNIFLPLYYKGELGFSYIIKQVFWLVELEQKVEGKKWEHSFKGMAELIKNKNHIIHDALKFRSEKIKDKKRREKFITKLKRYLKDLQNKQKKKKKKPIRMHKKP